MDFFRSPDFKHLTKKDNFKAFGTFNSLLAGLVRNRAYDACCSGQMAHEPVLTSSAIDAKSLVVTQPMLQRRPNCMELRSMDSHIQILCNFQKCKRKVSPPSLPCTTKSLFTPPKDDRVVAVEELFAYIFGI